MGRRQRHIRDELREHTKESGLERHGGGGDDLVVVLQELAVDEEAVVASGLDFFRVQGSESRHNSVHLRGREHERASPPFDERVEREGVVVGDNDRDGACGENFQESVGAWCSAGWNQAECGVHQVFVFVVAVDRLVSGAFGSQFRAS